MIEKIDPQTYLNLKIKNKKKINEVEKVNPLLLKTPKIQEKTHYAFLVLMKMCLLRNRLFGCPLLRFPL